MIDAIKVEGLSKRYRIGGRESYGTLRDTLAASLTSPLRRAASLFKKSAGRPAGESSVWALKDITFSARPGEVVGIVGRNGSGKSTLLKILSRITSPTHGMCEVRGNVRSLLEVGTGFHPELTGRENIYLNGAILGMKRSELNRGFDAIVDFAEVEKFIDTPVKHYSSGMYLRLAFAVAAHLRSEILLVDEVLAVGDAAFQRKCLGKMGEVTNDGRTILFVSHNMAAVRTLCSRGVLLDQGTLVYAGEIERVLFKYSQQLTVAPEQHVGSHTYFSGIKINSRNPGSIETGDRIRVECTVHIGQEMSGSRLFCFIQDSNGEDMVAVVNQRHPLSTDHPPCQYHVSVDFPKLWLKPGVYSVFFKLLGISAGAGKARFISDSAMLDVAGDSDPEALMGRLAPPAAWNVDLLSGSSSDETLECEGTVAVDVSARVE
jgi:lipopolysaccharide transport system ATP-binding protein